MQSRTRGGAVRGADAKPRTALMARRRDGDIAPYRQSARWVRGNGARAVRGNGARAVRTATGYGRRDGRPPGSRLAPYCHAARMGRGAGD